MNWLLSFLTNLSNFVLEALETGVGGLLACFVAKQVFQKSFDAWVSKRIEEVKGVVAKKVYVSKIKFDTEYQLYQELCSVFYDVAEMISVLVPYSLDERHFANFLQLQSEMQNL